MKPKVSVYIATSLDGYIARKNDDIEWLDEASAGVPEGEDCGYGELMKTVDLLVLGRRSYDKVLSFGKWPYVEQAVHVLSSKPIRFPDHIPDKVSCSSETPLELCERLSAEGVQHIYIDGGQTIQRFLAAGLVDEITITMIPVLLGDGIPLFGPLPSDINLSCLSATRFDFGFVQLKYGVRQTTDPNSSAPGSS